MNRRCTLLAAGLALAALAAAGPAGALPAYFSYPDLHGETIVFCAESDLWTVPLAGGEPRRLTTHAGDESFPAFSPDGRWIAFSGLYDGNLDVYLIPAAGGEPRRLTWHPGGDEVVGWTPDGAAVLFRSGRSSPFGFEMWRVPVAGGDPERLPIGYAYRLDIDPESGSWAFNRGSRERATWKRYRGGSASDLWVGHPARADFRQVTHFAGEDVAPMWHGGRIWFLSDQGGTYNLWSVLPDGSDRKRHTDFGQWDARWPSMAPDGRVVMTVAADIHVFDPESGRSRKVEIDLPSDRQLTRTRYPDPGRYLTDFDLAPEGDRLAIVARGEIFSVPVEDGVTLPITHGTGARERNACFGAKGEKIFYITDEPGEDEFRLIDAWGRGEPRVVKKAAKAWHLRPALSPDGKWVAWGDNDYRLWVQPLEGGKPVEVDRGANYSIREYAWSPDGRWLAYTLPLRSDFTSIKLYDTKEKKAHEVTGPYTNDYAPAWDPDGRYLYFASDRATNPIVGEVDYVNIEGKNDKLYLVLLRKDVKNPLAHLAGLPPEKDEEGKDGEKGKDGEQAKGEKAKGKDAKDKDAKDKDGKDEAPAPVEIDLEGLADRVVELPVERGRYGALAATATHLFYLSAPLKGMAERPGFFEQGEPDNTLRFFDLAEKEDDVFLEGVSEYTLAAKAGKVAVMKKPGELYVVGAAAAPGPKLAEDKVDLSDVVIELDPRQEWAQIYHEGWRQLREYYWDAEMSGVDWDGIRDQYAALLPRLSSRADLSDLLGQVFGEMNTSHTYVWGGDPGVRVERRQVGLLGAELVREGNAYRVARILRGDPADCVRSPLAEPGVDVAEGEYIVAINRRPLNPQRPLLAHLENLAGKEILISVNGKPALEGAREVVVVPLASEGDLVYSDWVRRNREYVAEKTGGKIGYVHVPDMGTAGLVEFNTWFFPQLDKEGMIVDVRWNGGGSVSQMLVEILSRKPQSFSLARGGGVSTYPDRCLNGPFVVLTNEFAGSDGDIFPQACQLGKLAPVIGIRSWGGVIGIRSLRPLVDGGLVTNPEVAWWDPRDEWGLENRGVVPDIEVPNLPQDLARGVDAQLDRGIAEVLSLHRKQPPVRPDFGEDRTRARRAYLEELKD